MDGDRWQRVREIFQTALEHEVMEWPAVVAEACGGDDDLRAEVESLLAAHRAAEGFLAGPPEDELEILKLPLSLLRALDCGCVSGGHGVVSRV